MQNGQGTGRRLSAVTALAVAPWLMANAEPAQHDVKVTVTDLRSSDGKILGCLTAKKKAFPNCDKDPDAKAVTVNAGETVTFTFKGVAPGEYAISLLHDENGNGRWHYSEHH